VDFENLEGWTVKPWRGEATLSRSQGELTWGDFVGKLEYSGNPEKGGNSYVLQPPEPIPVPGPFDSINLWVWNDYWGWSGDRGKPQERMSVLLNTAAGKEVIKQGGDWVFRYRVEDGVLQYTYVPERGDLGDVRARWNGQETLQPLGGGGVRFAVDRQVEGLLNVGGVYRPREPKALAPDKAELIECEEAGDCSTLGSHAGYILAPAHLFQPDVPREPPLAMFDLGCRVAPEC